MPFNLQGRLTRTGNGAPLYEPADGMIPSLTVSTLTAQTATVSTLTAQIATVPQLTNVSSIQFVGANPLIGLSSIVMPTAFPLTMGMRRDVKINTSGFGNIDTSGSVIAGGLAAPSGSIGSFVANTVLVNQTVSVSSITCDGITVFGAPVGVPGQTLLASYSGTATGTSASAFLTSGGDSNIPVAVGGVYAVSAPSMTFDTGTPSGPYGFTLLLNNTSNDIKIFEAQAASYATGQPDNLKAAQLGSVVFKANDSNVQFVIATSGGAGVADVAQANLATPTLTRIR